MAVKYVYSIERTAGATVGSERTDFLEMEILWTTGKLLWREGKIRESDDIVRGLDFVVDH